MPIYLYVYGDPNVQLSGSVQTQVQPGTPFTLTLSALNSGTDKASNVTVTLVNQSNFTALGPYSFNMGSIAAGSSSTEPIYLEPLLNISGGSHTLAFQVNYTDQTGNAIRA